MWVRDSFRAGGEAAVNMVASQYRWQPRGLGSHIIATRWMALIDSQNASAHPPAHAYMLINYQFSLSDDSFPPLTELHRRLACGWLMEIIASLNQQNISLQTNYLSWDWLISAGILSNEKLILPLLLYHYIQQDMYYDTDHTWAKAKNIDVTAHPFKNLRWSCEMPKPSAILTIVSI